MNDNYIELYTENEELKFDRRLARDVAFKYVFAWQYGCDEEFEQIKNLAHMQFRGRDKEYIEKAFLGVKNNLEKFDAIISENTKGWAKERLSKVCLAALRLGLCEMVCFDDIPAAVTINEIIEIIKKYDSPETGSFANGILGNIQKNLGE